MGETLKLAHELALPAGEAITQKYGFIGRSGSGKSYAAMKLAELFLGHGGQVIALDWVGVWWSLRLNRDGTRPGFEHVYIFGGEHADVPLEPTSGALMADLVVDKHISVVLDVMHFRKAERTRFATAFAEQFFHRKKTARTACHLFIEEAQAYLPQMVRGDEARMVGVFEDIGKVGRNYGIGNSLISQRPQALNKDVLNQVEVLLAFQTNGPQERKAIAGWTAENTTAGAAMMQALPTLETGRALVWSPSWLRVARDVRILPRETYDASSTPTHRAQAVAPKTLAPADLEQLGDTIRATVEKAKADDPKELRRKVVELERQLAKAQQDAPSKAAPVLTDADRERLDALLSLARRLREDRTVLLADVAARAKMVIDGALAEAFEDQRRVQSDFAAKLQTAGLQRVLGKLDQATGNNSGIIPTPNRTPVAQHARPANPHSPTGSAHIAEQISPRGRVSPSGRESSPPSSSGTPLKAMHRAMLTALAQHPHGLSKKQILIHTGYASSGPVSTAFADLARGGAVTAAGPGLQITSEGLRQLGDYEKLPLGDALRAHLLSSGRLSTMEAALLRAICDAYPQPIRKGAVLEATGYKSSGPVSSAFAKLVKFNYVRSQGPALLIATEELFG